MKMVVPITVDDGNMTTDAVAESYDEWGTTYSVKTMDTAPAVCIAMAINSLNGDIWIITVNGNIYHKTTASGEFTYVANTPDTQDIDVNPYTGRVYYVSNNSSGTSFSLSEIDPLTYDVTELDNVAGTNLYGMRLTIDMYTSDVYISGLNQSDIWIYEEAAAAISVHASSIGISSVQDIAFDSDNRNVYAVAFNATPSAIDVYVQTGATGAFALLIENEAIYEIQVNPLDSSLIGVYLGEIFTAAYEATTWSSLYDTGVASHFQSFYFDFAGLGYAYSWSTITLYRYSARGFEKGDYVIYDDRVYYALADSYNTRPGTDDTVWFDYGATNPYRMFDGTISSPTTATEVITLTLDNDNITDIGFFGVTAQEIQVVLTVDTVEVYNETIELRSTEVGDWYEYFFNPINQIRDIVFENIPAYSSGSFDITISGASETDTVEVGLMVSGYGYDVGITKRGVKPGFVNYSSTEVDAFGRIAIVSRGSAKTLDCECFLDSRTQASAVIDLYNRTKDTKCLWVGSRDADTWSLIYGICKRFDAAIEDNNGRYSLQILGVV